MPSETRVSHLKTRNYQTKDHKPRQEDRQLVQKAEPSVFEIVCADLYLSEIRELDDQFQQQHLEANALVDPSNQEAIERQFEEMENDDDGVRENIRNLLFFLSTSKSKPQGAKSADSQGKRCLKLSGIVLPLMSTT